MKKPGRNDLCDCGSGKKFKKCCERKLIGKKFRATKIEPKQESSKMVSFFKKKITEIDSLEKIPQETKKSIKADIKKKEKSE
jgi:hypothetical protein